MHSRRQRAAICTDLRFPGERGLNFFLSHAQRSACWGEVKSSAAALSRLMFLLMAPNRPRGETGSCGGLALFINTELRGRRGRMKPGQEVIRETLGASS